MEIFVKYLWRWALGYLTTPRGGIGTTVELESGYSTECDRAEKRRILEERQEALLADPDLNERDGVTHCNIALRRIAAQYGFDFPEDELANEQVGRMESGPRWAWDSGDRAAAHAMRGGLAVAGKRYGVHGHVATIAPRPMELSGSLGHDVPIVANVGKGVSKYCKVSEAFPPSKGEPGYFLLDVELQS